MLQLHSPTVAVRAQREPSLPPPPYPQPPNTNNNPTSSAARRPCRHLPLFLQRPVLYGSFPIPALFQFVFQAGIPSAISLPILIHWNAEISTVVSATAPPSTYNRVVAEGAPPVPEIAKLGVPALESKPTNSENLPNPALQQLPPASSASPATGGGGIAYLPNPAHFCPLSLASQPHSVCFRQNNAGPRNPQSGN